MEDQPFLQVYTPGSDLAAGFNLGQIIWGRTGDDTILGFQPLESEPGQSQVDLLIGDLAIDDPLLRQWNDTYVLGDWQQPYYAAGGGPQPFGLNDFAFVADFNPALDTVQLFGDSSLYQLLDLGLGSALVQQQNSAIEVISFFLGNPGLSLTADYFDFQGFTPPDGPVLPEAQQLGTPGFDIAPAIATDPSGEVYVAGGTTGSLAASNNGESRDAFVATYDEQGNQIDAFQFGTSQFDTISSIATDNDGNFYVAGITAGELEGTEEAVDTDAFVAKYNSAGEQQWIEQFGRNLIFQSFGIDVDDQGNAYVSGIDVREGPPPEFATDDFWVSKFDTNGNQEWLTTVNSVDDAFDESYSVAVSNDGSVYATGWTLGDLEAPNANAGLYDSYVTKFDNDGDVEWIRQFGTSDYEWGRGVDTDSDGNVYATGWTLGDLAGENTGSYDAWLFKYDSQGTKEWSKQFGSEDADDPFDIFIDTSDNIFLAGYTNGDLGDENAGSFDFWVARFDTEGNQVWLQQYGTPDFDQAYGITGDNAGNLYITGVTQGSLGGDNNGSVDSWLAKLDTESGSLLDFSGSANAVSTAALLDFSSQTTTAQSYTDEEAIAYIKTFFETFTTETLGLALNSGGPTGAGLEGLIDGVYGGRPSEAVPEPSLGVSLLTVAALTWAMTHLKKRVGH